MRVRDSLIVATVLLVGGFAAADALRGDGNSGRAPTAETVQNRGVPRPARTEDIETVEGTGLGLIEGHLVYTDAACAVRELDLARGEHLPIGTIRTSCALVSPVSTERVAFSLPSRRRAVVPYRVVDLSRPGIDLETFRARIRSVVWSADGTRIAWCDQAGRGQELVVSLVDRTLPNCPIAFDPGGSPVYARGRDLIVEGRRVLRAPARIEAVSFGDDGTLAVADAGGRVVLYGQADFRVVSVVRLPPELRGLRTLFSPTHCHAALLSSVFPPTPTIFVVDLRPCPGSRAPVTFAGRAAAWSPDGSRLAAAERQRVVVHPLFRKQQAVTLDLIASDLAWKF
jgi:WD40 repeat protein